MQRERLTITLDTDLLAAVDTTIDRSQIRNRSHAIEHAIREGLALHELTHVVINTGSTELLPGILQLLQTFSIQEYLIIAPAGGNGAELVQSVQTFCNATVSLIPGDFGSGAALLLNKDRLTKTFLYINLDTLTLPTNLVPAYVFHRRNNGTVTHLLHNNNATFSWAGISFLEPIITDSIPAGLASLETTTFPNLAKSDRVITYVF